MADIAAWLGELGLGQYAEVFAANDVDLGVLFELNEHDLAALGLSLGHRKRLLRAIAQARTPEPRAPNGAAPARRGGRREGERRQLTVMFCDLVGSTPLSMRLDPEDLRDVIASYQSACREVIGQFGGHIGHYVGDGILVYFGYPEAHEDDAQRAVRAGLGIVEAITALNSRTAPVDVALAVRIGIHTGVVVAGDIGTGDHRDEMAIVGETPNIAARLQALAEPGTVVIGKSTERLVEGLFVLEDLGAHALKGIEAPVPAYRVRALSDAPNRFEAKASRGLTPLVGRSEEIRLLLARWEHVKQGHGQVVLISGEPGIGKSRLVQTLRQELSDGGQTTSRLFCSPFYVNSALYPFLDQLERVAGLQREDPAPVKLDKLEQLLGLATPRAAEAVAVLAPLMSIPLDERHPPLDLTPQQRKAKAFEVFTEQLVGLATRQPLLLIVEDVHWIDPSSAELFHRLIARAQHLPVLVLMTFRPQFQPPWPIHPNVTTLLLNRLSHRQAAALAERVTGGKALPWEVLDQIVTRTDGIPLFIEELTKNMLESGLFEDAGDRYVLSAPLPPFAIPASLQDSLMARLDRLAAAKELAQLAATLGRAFSHELIEAVGTLKDPELGQGLALLIEAELLYRRGSPPNVIYDFKHGLLQDAAYASLLRTKRQQFHMRIGTILEERFPETIETRPELLSHHFRQAGLPERAIPYAIKAGDLAAARYAGAEARARYQEALQAARALPDSDDAARAQIQATLKLASVALHREHYEADLADLAEAAALAEAQGDRQALCDVEYWRGRLNYVLGRFDEGVAYAQRALESAEADGADDTVLAAPVNLLARLHCLRGEPCDAIAHAARNVQQMHRLDNRIEEAAISGVLAFAHGMHGDFEQAFAAADYAVRLARQLDHLPTLAACLHFCGVVRGWHGDLDTAGPSFEEALALSERSGDLFRRYLAHGWRGEAWLCADRVGPAEADLVECLALGDRIGTTFHRAAFEAFMARIRLLKGDVSTALEVSEHALQVAGDTGQAWSRSIALRVQAEALLACQPPEVARAEDAIREALGIQEQRECCFDLAWSRVVAGRVSAAKGDAAAAGTAFAAAHRGFEAMGISHDGTRRALSYWLRIPA